MLTAASTSVDAEVRSAVEQADDLVGGEGPDVVGVADVPPLDEASAGGSERFAGDARPPTAPGCRSCRRASCGPDGRRRRAGRTRRGRRPGRVRGGRRARPRSGSSIVAALDAMGSDRGQHDGRMVDDAGWRSARRTSSTSRDGRCSRRARRPPRRCGRGRRRGWSGRARRAPVATAASRRAASTCTGVECITAWRGGVTGEAPVGGACQPCAERDATCDEREVALEACSDAVSVTSARWRASSSSLRRSASTRWSSRFRAIHVSRSASQSQSELQGAAFGDGGGGDLRALAEAGVESCDRLEHERRRWLAQRSAGRRAGRS